MFPQLLYTVICKKNIWCNILLFFLLFLYPNSLFSQIVSPFNARYQNNQKGGITFISNVSVSCGSASGCSAAQQQTVTTGGNSNGAYTQAYVDIDGNATTYMSTSDSLNLANCSEILWAGLYWSARINAATPNYLDRNKVKLKVGNGVYQQLTADQLLDVPTINGANWSHPSYYCFKNITTIVQNNGIKGRYTLADLVTQTGTTNLWGGWSIVVVFKNVYEPMRNLTVYDGFANVSIGNSLDIPISGFVTPLAGPVTFELGVIALDGDRDSQGDQLQFNGAGTFVNISDALHNTNNFFNSMIAENGIITPFRNPNYSNSLGYDAGIFSPSNATYQYISNGASNATIRITTSSENILSRVITSAIDVYEPDIRATVRINDLNGGLVNPGDILEYTMVGKNIGSDISVGTFMTDTLDPRVSYIPNTIQVTYGPNLGPKTDVTGDDQGEYIAADKVVKVRIGTGANAITGGQVNNSNSGADSTVIKFQVLVNNDCLIFECDNTLDNVAYIFGEGNISGNSYDNDGVSDELDANGCPMVASNELTINTSTCAPPSISSNGPVCPGSTLNLSSTISSTGIYNWTGPNGFTSVSQNPAIPNVTNAAAGTYFLSISYNGLDCTVDTNIVVNIFNDPVITNDSIVNVSCFGENNGSIALTSSGTAPITYLWSTGSTSSSISNLSPGIYSVTITNGNGCSIDTSFTISQPLLLGATATATTNYNGFNISCFSFSDGGLTVNASGGTAPYTYLWSNGSTSQSQNLLPAGNYSVTVTDFNGCSTISQVVLNQPNPLSLNPVLVNNVSCFGGNNGSIDVTASGGVPNYSYNWSNGSNIQDVANLSSGNYSLNVTDANGCSISDSFSVIQPNNAITLSETHVDVLCFNGNNGSIDLTISGGTTPYSILWSTNSNSEDLNSLSAGNYTATVSDFNGCQETISVTINQPNAPISNSSILTNILCFGNSTGSINISPSGGTLPYNYLWSDGQSSQDLSNVPAGNFSVQITDNNGCIFNESFTLTQPSFPLTQTSSLTNVSCQGGTNGSIITNPNGGNAPYSFNWSNGSFANSITNLSAGNYSVTITDASGCSIIENYAITEPTVLTISLIADSVYCFGESTGSIDATINGGTLPYSYFWNNGVLTEDLSSLPQGNYTLTVTDFNGCSNQSTITVNQTPLPLQLSLSETDVLCFGNSSGAISTNVSGGNPVYSYLWSNGSLNSSISNVPSGIYSVTVTDFYGCSAMDSVEISEPNNNLSLTANITDVNCFGGSDGSINLSVAGGTIPYSYSWSNGQAIQDLTGLISGNYTILVTDFNGCQIDSLFQVDQPNQPLSLSNSTNNVSCFNGNNGTINLTVNGGTSPYSFNWSNGSAIEDQTNLFSGFYSVIVTDDNGCFENETIQITQPPILIQSALTTNVLCFGGNTGAINLSVNGGTTPYQFSWSNGSILEDINNLVVGFYQVTITDNNGCTLPANYTISGPLAPLQLTENHIDVSCFGGSDGSIDLSSSGGTSPYNYSWNSGQNTQDLNNIQAGNYIVTATDFNNCQSQLSISISQPNAPLNFSEVHQNVLCFGQATGSINLTVGGGTPPYLYQWSNGETSEDISNLLAGNYSVQISDGNGCSVITSVTISQPSSPLTLTETHQDAVCTASQTGAINLSVAGGTLNYSYLWTNGATTQDISSLGEGIYGVTVTDGNGCTQNLSITINDPDNDMILNEVHSNVSCFGGAIGTIILTITDIPPTTSINWSNGSSSEDINGLAVGNYFVTVTNLIGCTSFLSVQITQPDEPVSISSIVSNVVCFGQTNGGINISVTGGTAPYSYLWSNGAITEDIGNLSAGNYSVVITDFNGCILNSSFTITEPNTPISATATISNVSCFGGNNGSIDLTISGGVSPYSFSWSNGATTEDLNGLSANTYSVVIQDFNGCNSTVNNTIEQPANGIQISSLLSNVSCFGGNDGSINISVSGGTSSYTYLWNNGSTSQNLTNITAGTYSLQITDFNGCIQTESFQILEPLTPLIATVNVTNVLCHNGATGTASVISSGGTAPYVYNWSNGDNTTTIDSLIAGNISVLVTDSEGCTVAINSIISQPSPVVAQTTNTNILCYGQSTGSISIVVNGGITPNTYLWNTGSTQTFINNLPAGPYFVTVTDANNCPTTFSDTVYQPATPIDINSLIVDNICFGENDGSINNTITGGTAPYQSQWNTGDLSEDLTNLLAGQYTITVLDNNGCLLTENITVNQPPIPITITGVVIPVSCFGGSNGSINVTVTGPDAPFSYSWNNGIMTEDLNNLTAGTYILDVTNFNGCSTQSSFIINQPLTPLSYSTIINSVSCFGGNDGSIDLTVNGSTPPYNYAWSNGVSTQDVNSLIAGNYIVIITDANGCQLTVNEQILEPSSPNTILLTTSNVNCYGQATGSIDISPNGGTPGYTYLWSNGSISEDVFGLSAGSYSVQVTDAEGCLITSSAIISEPSQALQLVDSIAMISCFGGSNGEIYLNLSGGTTPYSINWNNGSTNDTLTNLAVGNYSVDITDALGCQLTDNFTITQPNAALSLTSTNANVSCFNGSNGSVNITVLGGTSPYSFNWSNGLTTEDLVNVPAGNYSVTVLDANGCQLISSFTLTQPNSYLVSLNPQNVICFGGNTGSIQSSVLGGTSPYTYLWNNGSANPTATGLLAGNYSLTVYDANGCVTSASTTVAQPSFATVINGSVTNETCSNTPTGSIDLSITSVNPIFSYFWNNGMVTDDISNLISGNYNVTATDINGCVTTASFIVNTAVPITSSSIITQVDCNGNNSGAINVTISGGSQPYTYLWSNGSSAEDINSLEAGVYFLTVTDFLNCSQNFSYTVTEPADSLEISGLMSPILCFGGSNGALDLVVTGGTTPYNYQWENGNTNQDLVNVPANVYSVIVTDNNGCQVIDSFLVAEPLPLSLNAILTNPSCFAGNNGGIDIQVFGGIEDYQYQWSNGSITEDLISVDANNYTLNVIDINGCVLDTAFTLNQPQNALNISLSATNVSCFNGTDGSVDLTVNGGTSPYVISWSNGAITEDLQSIIGGNYLVNVTDDNGCSVSGSINVNTPLQPLSVTGVIQNVSCFNGSNGSVNISVNGGTPSYSYLWSNGITNQDLLNVPAGSYSVTITDAEGCTLSESYTITEPASGLALSYDVSNVNCFGGATGAISINVNGGVLPYNFLWSNGSTFEDIANLTAGNYDVTISDATGCSIIENIQVSQPAAPIDLTAVLTNVTCNGLSNGSINITPTGGTVNYSFNWSNGAISEDLQNLVAGNYSLTITDAQSCQFDTLLTVTEPAVLQVSSVNTNILCFGNSTGGIDLSVIGGTLPYSYTWSNGILTEDLTAIPFGSYTVDIIDNNGCTLQYTTTLTQPAQPLSVSETHQDILCYGNSTGNIDLTVTGGTPGYNYSWDTGQNSEDIINLPSGTYNVLIEDANNCQETISITLTQPQSPIGISAIINNVDCSGNSTGVIDITTTGGTPNYQFSWDNGSIMEDLQNISSGNYTLTVIDANLCQIDSTFSITEPTALSASSVNVNILCNGASTGGINLTVSGGVTPYSFDWSNGSISEDLSSIPAGDYTVDITDANGCLYTYSTTLIQPILPLTITETHQNVLCFGANNGSIDLTVTGGTPNYTYLWNTGSTNQDLSSLIAGNYSVLVTDANNCVVNLPINISQPSAPLTLSSNVTNVNCFGLASGAIDITINGGTAPFTYFWNTGAVNQDLINIPAGQYTIAVTDFNNCVSSTIINLSQPASALSVSVNSTDISCFGYSDGTALLSISGGSPAYDILWNTGATTNFINNLPAGSYSATITDANGCENNVNIQLNQPAAIVPTFTYTINGICSPVAVEFTNTSQGSPTNCIWELGNGESVNSCDNFTYSYSEPGCYSVTLNTTLNNGCSSSLTLDSIICVQPGPTADFVIVQSSDVYYSGNVQFNNSSVNADFYTWDFGDNTPTSEEVDPLHNYGTMSSNTYDVTLIAEDSLGCIDTALISFTIEEGFMVYVPNTFTLDNNNANEVFIPVFSDINDVKQYELLIFDRWGELIWQTTDKFKSWDGIYKGKKCQDGVYTWKLTYTRENNYITILVGHVNLLR